MTDYRERYEAWLNAPTVDDRTKAELAALAGNEAEIEDRFYKDLEFGTAGLRGVLGAGANRMNVYTVRRATQGMAQYLLKADAASKTRGVAIAFDSRNGSELFARETAAVFNANGIKTYVFETLHPVPMLSYTILHLHAKAGVVITASHNPAKYNGYKAYWEDGGQVPPPMDAQIIEEVNQVELFTGARRMPRAEAEAKGLYVALGEEIDCAYNEEIRSHLIDPQGLAKAAEHLRIVYTPLHGSGNLPVRRILQSCGFTDVSVVAEQELPNGDFPTVTLPNPENPQALAMGCALAEKIDADIVIGTDPDADRVGVMVKTASGYVPLNGNQMGVLLTYYILQARQATNRLPKDSFVVKSVVTSEMTQAVCDDFGVELRNVLTGFKYIGQQIAKAEQSGRGTYVFGFEESYGYLCGTYARDKDAVSATMLICEMAAMAKQNGENLIDLLNRLYQKYGYYREKVVSRSFEGASGAKEMKALMAHLRADGPKTLGGLEVLEVCDFLREGGYRDYPKSDMLLYRLPQGAWACIRPSGTEPKIKYYIGANGATEAASKQMEANIEKDLLA